MNTDNFFRNYDHSLRPLNAKLSRRVVAALAENPSRQWPQNELWEHLNIEQSQGAGCLRRLKQTGLIDYERRGKYHLVSLNQARFDALDSFLKSL